MTLTKIESQGRHLLSRDPRPVALTQDGSRMSQQQTEIITRAHMAVLIPRDWSEVQSKLLLACKNPEFTREAVYRRETNGEVHEGLSIRFAEIAHSLMRNVSVDNAVESEDDLSIHYRLTVSDTEANGTNSETYRVSKTVSRLGVKDDEIVLKQYKNGRGEQIYLVPATDEQIASRAGALKSRVKRQLILALIPADVRKQCLDACLELNKSNDATDPGAAIKALVLDFLGQGIETSDLKEYLGKPPTGATPVEIQALRGILTALRDGATTWREVMESKKALAEQKSAKEAFIQQKQQEKAAAGTKRKGGTEAVRQAAQETGNATPVAPARRGRRTNAQIAADKAAEEAAKNGAASDTKPETAISSPPPASQPSAPSLDEYEEDEEDGGGSAAAHLS